MSGWYKQQRNLAERPWFKDACMVQLYAFLKERAYVADGRYEGRVIRRGSCPITRSEMSEMTGMSLRTLDRVLRRLISYGEIIVRGNSRFSVVTVCDYDSLQQTESLFGTTDGISNGTTDGISGGITVGTTHLSTIEERIENNLITPYSPYKKERDSQDVVLEVKKRYNKFFDGVLPPLLRLHLPIRNMVAECIRRFGMQSIDIVFEQVRQEKFSIGTNRTGFIASFQYIFEPANFQKYLERAQLRRKKESQPQQQEESVGSIDAHVPESQPQPTEEDRRNHLLHLVEFVSENPQSLSRIALQAAYESGELDKYGIEWKPSI